MLLDGIFVATGAQISFFGKKQALAFCKSVSIPFSIRQTDISLKFGNYVVKSLGIMKFRFTVPTGRSIEIEMDVIDLDVPLLLGLR